jgi:uncharacterized protein (DUF1499 family)
MPPASLRNFLLSTAAFFFVLHGWTSWGETAGGTDDGKRIAGCPGSPNCVSSMSSIEDRWIAPLAFSTSSDEAFRCLEQIIRQMQRTTSVVAEAGYIHAEFRTFLGFVDDVEFQADKANRTVLMRSASRVGYWDMGVNRRRLEAIRAVFESKCR